MNNVDTERIDQVIKILKEKLDFFNKLENMIENGATGYELNFEIEQFEKYIKKKDITKGDWTSNIKPSLMNNLLSLSYF